MDRQAIYLAWLRSIPGMTYGAVSRLLAHAQSAPGIYLIAKNDVNKFAFLDNEKKAQLRRCANDDYIRGVVAELERLELAVFSDQSPEFPKNLLDLHDPPHIIYAKGRLEALSPCKSVAIVGSRKCSDYGKRVAYDFAKALATAGVRIISGMAFGIDHQAHQGALDSGREGATIAVIPGGAERSTPSSQRALYEAIAKGGLVLSEDPPGSAVYPSSFPVRNRIIAGLADCVLVVEATATSGSMHTVSAALELGKDVCAVPGRIGDWYSEGTLQLIKDGATPVGSPEDVLEMLGVEVDAKRYPQVSKAVEIQAKLGAADPVSAVLDDLSEDEKRVCAGLVAGEKSIDELIALTGLPAHKLLGVLTKLAAKSIIRRSAMNVYSL